MHFALTREHEMIVDTVRSFTENELIPHEAEVERTGHVSPELVEQIKQRSIAAGIYDSPCPESIPLSEIAGCRVYCKLDYLQRTGSFKERGARNALLLLAAQQRRQNAGQDKMEAQRPKPDPGGGRTGRAPASLSIPAILFLNSHEGPSSHPHGPYRKSVGSYSLWFLSSSRIFS